LPDSVWCVRAGSNCTGPVDVHRAGVAVPHVAAPPPGRGGQGCFIWAMRRWLPNGSRRPKSMPYGWSTGSSVISTPFALSSAWVL
jgi:hypothetical protein